MDPRRRLEVTPSTAPGVDYATLRTELLRCVRSVCPAWLGIEAEDICQQAMVKVMAAVERGDGATPPPTPYLRRVAYSATIDELRRRRIRAHDRTDDSGVRQAVTKEANPEQGVLLGEIGRDMFACLQQLDPLRRRAITLHLQGLVRHEVAGILGWTVKQTENRVYRGLADLRRCLSSKGHTP